jgi:flagellar hook assembly protein FlgD
LGQRVIALIDKEMTAGNHEYTWDGKLSDGAVLPSGIYFARLTAGGSSATRKMVVVK